MTVSEPTSSLHSAEAEKKGSAGSRSSEASSLSSALRWVRPDVQTLIEDAVAPLNGKKSVLIAGMSLKTPKDCVPFHVADDRIIFVRLWTRWHVDGRSHSSVVADESRGAKRGLAFGGL